MPQHVGWWGVPWVFYLISLHRSVVSMLLCRVVVCVYNVCQWYVFMCCICFPLMCVVMRWIIVGMAHDILVMVMEMEMARRNSSTRGCNRSTPSHGLAFIRNRGYLAPI